MEINFKQTRSIITKSNLPAADYVINPYIGCQHACIYCYADFMKKFTGHINEDWGKFLDVKTNAAETIKKINKKATILIGSVTDPYQPLEAKYKITRSCLKKLLSLQPKLEILTKSKLILRDLDLLKQFKRLKVGISIGILNDKEAKILEPFASLPSERIETLKKLSQEKISTYLFISPIFPGITDLKKLIQETKNNVDEILFENINIRENNRDKILDYIRKNHPDLKETYERISKGTFNWENIEERIKKECSKQKIPYKIFFHHGK